MDNQYPNQCKSTNEVERESQSDILRARFTKWLEVTIYRAKLKYIHKLSLQIETVSLDELIDSGFQPVDSSQADLITPLNPRSFDFTEEKLSKAFSNLTLKRRQILEMLFIEELSPEEIAQKLGYSVQHVYNQRSASLKKLKIAMMEEYEDE